MVRLNFAPFVRAPVTVPVDYDEGEWSEVQHIETVVLPVKVWERGRLRRWKSMIKVKCVEGLRRKRQKARSHVLSSSVAFFSLTNAISAPTTIITTPLLQPLYSQQQARYHHRHRQRQRQSPLTIIIIMIIIVSTNSSSSRRTAAIVTLATIDVTTTMLDRNLSHQMTSRGKKDWTMEWRQRGIVWCSEDRPYRRTR
ncbi:hypothetical protein MMC07_009108 [Pseudocyphellaria aurata]|nr:hypothetical protein [Pseudocyphellaria aurata]